MMQIQLNGHLKTVQAGATVSDLLAQLDLVDKRVAVEINREIIPRSQHATHVVQPDDRVEVVVAVGGG